MLLKCGRQVHLGNNGLLEYGNKISIPKCLLHKSNPCPLVAI